MYDSSVKKWFPVEGAQQSIYSLGRKLVREQSKTSLSLSSMFEAVIPREIYYFELSLWVMKNVEQNIG